MLTREQFTDILLTLANKDAYGAASLGYLPHMLYAKWLLDNEEYAENPFIGMKGTYSDNYGDLPSLNHLDVPFSKEALHPFGADDDREGLFRNLSDEFALHQYHKLYGKFDEVKDHITKILMSLDLSEASIPRSDIAAGFDAYLAEMLEAGGASFTLDAGIPEKLIGCIMKDSWYGKPERIAQDPQIYDPFCKFGALFAETSGNLLQGKMKKEPSFVEIPGGEIRSESPIYLDIAHIRLAFHGVVGTLDHSSPISSPMVARSSGEIDTYDWVISDISGIESSAPSSAFQLDIHKRYQTYCPDAEYLNQDTAMLTAYASVGFGGYMAVITGWGNSRIHTLFATLDPGAVKSFLLQDTLEAVIDVPVRTSEEIRETLHRRTRMITRSHSKRIYIFVRGKSAERQGKILFINGISTGNEVNLIETIVKCYHDFTVIPGFSAIVSLDKIIMQTRPVLDPDKYTKIIEEPESVPDAILVQDLQVLENRRISLNKDIISYVEKLTRTP